MVQMRCRLTGGYPCGDWPRDGYTWQFWPPFVVILAVWAASASVLARRSSLGWIAAADTLGETAAPMLGLVLTWAWYGLTGERFHNKGGCTVPILCHDVLPMSLVIWSGPWIFWGAWRLVSLWRRADNLPKANEAPSQQP